MLRFKTVLHLDVVPDPLERQGLVIQPHVTRGLLTAQVEKTKCSDSENKTKYLRLGSKLRELIQRPETIL